MTALNRLVREPLLHFLVAGALLFALYHLVRGPRAEANAQARSIVVDPHALLSFMQYESMAFRPDVFEARLAALSPQQKRELIDEYVREEALVREATIMGLADGDYVIRRRMAQKLLYLMDDAATESFSPDEATLRRYFSEHESRYRTAPTLTFTHVFVDKEIRRGAPAEKAAERLKRALEAARAGFGDAPAYGDRFPYLRNCIKRAPDFIESQFGAQFTGELVKLAPSEHWQGPIPSEYGYHLVLLTQREPAHLPDFEDVKAQVKEEMLRESLAAYRETAIKDLVSRYSVALKDVSLAAADQPDPAQGTAAGPRRLARTASP
jgi:PPIC-type PPIASE domain